MIAILRQMILSITAAAIFGSVMLTLVRKSAIQEIVRLATGMLMILALLQPLQVLRIPSFGVKMPQDTEIQQQNTTLSFTAIEQATAQVIEQQAAAQGILCKAEVTMSMQAEVPQVQCIRISGTGIPQEKLREIVKACCPNAFKIEFVEESP